MNENIQDYLKTILTIKLKKKTDKVTVSEIAHQLKISVPAVTDKIKRLVKLEFVTNIPYKGVHLTEKGYQAALNMIKRHRLWEMFLTQALGIPKDRVHNEAERLEHACSDYLIDVIDKALNYPTIDPHGQPIYPDQVANTGG